MEITYLTSQRKQHLRNHFELRGSLYPGQGGRNWWLVFDEGDYRPELVGSEDKLPSYARAQLARLRQPPNLGERRKARYINAHLTFFPGQACGGIPHVQNVDWLQQYRPKLGNGFYSVLKGYLVVLVGSHNEDYPVEIWESRGWPPFDELGSDYQLVWKREPEED